MNTKTIKYQEQETQLLGYAAWPEGKAPFPVVMVAPTNAGCNEEMKERACKLAQAGYIGFAIDIYGEGQQGKSHEESMSLMKPFMEDRSLLLRRMQAGLKQASSLEQADTQRVVAIGYCFGGLAALDLVRSDADLCGVAAFHALLKGGLTPTKQIKAKVLVMHGDLDPMVSQEEINDFRQEMNKLRTDWQLHIYGGALHSFTNKNANAPNIGKLYHKSSDDRSWRLLLDFFGEVLAK